MVSPNTIEESIKKRVPELSARFNTGIEKSELDSIEESFGIKFPDSFRKFYLAADGQVLDDLGCASGVPAIPSMQLPGQPAETTTWGEFLPLQQALMKTRSIHHNLPPDLLLDDFDSNELPIEFIKNTRNHFIFCDPGSGDSIGLVHAPGKFEEPFCVMAFNHDPGLTAMVAPTFTDFLEMVNQSILSKDYYYCDDGGVIRQYDS